MTTHTPTETQVKDCVQLMRTGYTPQYPEIVQGFAQLQLADFSAVLTEWTLPQTDAQAQPLPKVAAALKQGNLSPEQGAKLWAFLQQLAQQGQRTAALYQTYLLATGQFVAQQPRQAATLARQLARQGDWRAARFLGEMLAVAPLAASELLAHEVQAACTEWHKQHPEFDAQQVQAACMRFVAAPAAVKYAAKQWFELAIEQGSPTAAQRLRGLSVLGLLSAALPPPRFRSLHAFLDTQLQSTHPMSDADDDPDIMVLPEHIAMPIHGDDEERPVWYKPMIYGLFALFAVLLFTLLTKSLFHK